MKRDVGFPSRLPHWRTRSFAPSSCPLSLVFSSASRWVPSAEEETRRHRASYFAHAARDGTLQPASMRFLTSLLIADGRAIPPKILAPLRNKLLATKLLRNFARRSPNDECVLREFPNFALLTSLASCVHLSQNVILVHFLFTSDIF